MTPKEAKDALERDIKAAEERYARRLLRAATAAKRDAALKQRAVGFRLKPLKPRPSDPLRAKAHEMRAAGASYAQIAKEIGKSRSYIPILLSKKPRTEAELLPQDGLLSPRAHSLLHKALRMLAPKEYDVGRWRPQSQGMVKPDLVSRVFNPTRKRGFDSPYYGLGQMTLDEINAWLIHHGYEPKNFS